MKVHPIQVAADWSPDDSMLVTEEMDPLTGFLRLFIVDAEVISFFSLSSFFFIFHFPLILYVNSCAS